MHAMASFDPVELVSPSSMAEDTDAAPNADKDAAAWPSFTEHVEVAFSDPWTRSLFYIMRAAGVVPIFIGRQSGWRRILNVMWSVAVFCVLCLRMVRSFSCAVGDDNVSWWEKTLLNVSFGSLSLVFIACFFASVSFFRRKFIRGFYDTNIAMLALDDSDARGVLGHLVSPGFVTRMFRTHSTATVFGIALYFTVLNSNRFAALFSSSDKLADVDLCWLDLKVAGDRTAALWTLFQVITDFFTITTAFTALFCISLTLSSSGSQSAYMALWILRKAGIDDADGDGSRPPVPAPAPAAADGASALDPPSELRVEVMDDDVLELSVAKARGHSVVPARMSKSAKILLRAFSMDMSVGGSPGARATAEAVALHKNVYADILRFMKTWVVPVCLLMVVRVITVMVLLFSTLADLPDQSAILTTAATVVIVVFVIPIAIKFKRAEADLMELTHAGQNNNNGSRAEPLSRLPPVEVVEEEEKSEDDDGHGEDAQAALERAHEREELKAFRGSFRTKTSDIAWMQVRMLAYAVGASLVVATLVVAIVPLYTPRCLDIKARVSDVDPSACSGFEKLFMRILSAVVLDPYAQVHNVLMLWFMLPRRRALRAVRVACVSVGCEMVVLLVLYLSESMVPFSDTASSFLLTWYTLSFTAMSYAAYSDKPAVFRRLTLMFTIAMVSYIIIGRLFIGEFVETAASDTASKFAIILGLPLLEAAAEYALFLLAQSIVVLSPSISSEWIQPTMIRALFSLVIRLLLFNLDEFGFQLATVAILAATEVTLRCTRPLRAFFVGYVMGGKRRGYANWNKSRTDRLMLESSHTRSYVEHISIWLGLFTTLIVRALRGLSQPAAGLVIGSIVIQVVFEILADGASVRFEVVSLDMDLVSTLSHLFSRDHFAVRGAVLLVSGFLSVLTVVVFAAIVNGQQQEGI